MRLKTLPFAVTFALSLTPQLASADFSGDYAPANWILSNSSGGDGSVDISGAPNSIVITGSDNGSPSNYTDYAITLTNCSSCSASFDWAFQTLDIDGAGPDRAYYLVDGSHVALDNGTVAPINGSLTITGLTNGGTIGWSVYTSDGIAGPGILTISNFSILSAYIYTLASAQASLSSTNLGLQSTLATTGTLVNGAHSRPMSRRVDTGKKTFWVAGDWGNDNHHERDGRVGLAEVGGGYNFGPAQMNISLGKTWASQDLIHNGDVDSDGKYIMVEGIVPLSVDNGIYATIGTYYHWGDMDIDRGYLNMGNLDQSSASPDTDTWGVRARVDWENAFTLSTARFSPYADLWHSKTKLDSYTETGGGFPAHFNSREDRITELRAGLNAAMPINQSNFDFIANIEAVHRFDDKADSTSGQVVGLFAFNLDGEDYDQNWFKGGVGIEGVLGDGKVSLMLNGTTKGEMASSWVAASYQMAF